MPGDRGVNLGIREGICAQSGDGWVAWLRTGQGSAGAISTSGIRPSGVKSMLAGSDSGRPAMARSASPDCTISMASAASPVVSLISTCGCSARKRSRIGGRGL